jgi:hypothetical protein
LAHSVLWSPVASGLTFTSKKRRRCCSGDDLCGRHRLPFIGACCPLFVHEVCWPGFRPQETPSLLAKATWRTVVGHLADQHLRLFHEASERLHLHAELLPPATDPVWRAQRERRPSLLSGTHHKATPRMLG